MYSEDYEGTFSRERSSDEIYSKPVKAGKRTYFFDVKILTSLWKGCKRPCNILSTIA